LPAALDFVTLDMRGCTALPIRLAAGLLPILVTPAAFFVTAFASFLVVTLLDVVGLLAVPVTADRLLMPGVVLSDGTRFGATVLPGDVASIARVKS
jgi:hypothetical protein